MMQRRFILILSLLLFFIACKEDTVSIPKPRMYPKINFPTVSKHNIFDRDACPFSFEYPDYADIRQSSETNEAGEINDCWFDIHFPDLKAVLYCSYEDITSNELYENMINKNYLLVNKHNRKADFINENIIIKNDHSFGVQFEIEGEVATPYQFFLSDSTRHFFRASLYFNAPPSPDSIAPVYKFVRKDIDKMIASFEWK